MAAFFDEPWSRVAPNFTEAERAWLLHEAAHRLRSLGRLTEALQPMRAGLELDVQQQNWKQAAISANNLSQLEATLGRLVDAVDDSRRSITYADQTAERFQMISKRTTAAEALHLSGQRAAAGSLFTEAERLQQKPLSGFDLLFSLAGFWYCEWLLAPAERTAWQALLGASDGFSAEMESHGRAGHTICAEVERRGAKMFQWRQPSDPLLNIALDYLTMARVGLIRAILTHPPPQPTLELPQAILAVNGLRESGCMDFLPKGLLTAALYHFVRDDPATARTYLDQAHDIAARGPMPLYLADIHLHRARLFRDKAELAKAAKLIRDLGYGRRYDELADAEAALGGE